MNSHTKSKFILVIFLLLGSGLFAQETVVETADGFNLPFINLEVTGAENNQEVAFSLQLLLILTVISLAPSIFVLMTAFLRIAIVMDFVKRSLSLQQVPPNQVLMGIALFLTLFIMWPVFTNIYDEGFVPFSNGEIGLEEFYGEVEQPMRLFMYRQMQDNNHDEIRLFMRLSGLPRPETFADVPTHVLIPAFVLHELTVAFMIGILLFIPFIIVDMVVASTLMAMGMIMLPPVMISLPFKLILFVLVDGWGLITTQVVNSFVF
jgi:flagellar biosynthetic protein FliP